jgi:hypothetical protein
MTQYFGWSELEAELHRAQLEMLLDDAITPLGI